MTFITHGFRVSVESDVRDLGTPLRFMLRRSSLVECVSVWLNETRFGPKKISTLIDALDEREIDR
jgi:hypothetical protein